MYLNILKKVKIFNLDYLNKKRNQIERFETNVNKSKNCIKKHKSFEITKQPKKYTLSNSQASLITKNIHFNFDISNINLKGDFNNQDNINKNVMASNLDYL